MPGDKFTAVWVSHSSISDFLACPRSYFLKNVYKDPKTNHKMQIISPPLALGQVVHDVIESLSVLTTSRRFEQPLIEKLEQRWETITGAQGGFPNDSVEQQYKRRAEEMLRRITQHPGPLLKLAVKIKEELPYYWLSEDDNIILCGKIDWLEYDKDEDCVSIIDFKTGKGTEDESSLQLPIYYLLTTNCQSRPVKAMSYWYIERDDEPVEQTLPDGEKAQDDILKIAKKMKLARQLQSFTCPNGPDGCNACRPYEAVLRGQATKVGTGNHGQDVFVLEQVKGQEEESVIL